MVTEARANTDIQVGRYALLEDLAFANWLGIQVELGGRGGLVQMWAVHHYSSQAPAVGSGPSFKGSALSSNPDHLGEQAALDLDEFMGSPALYATACSPSYHSLATTGASENQHFTEVIPLYGIIRPRRQVWVLYLVQWLGSYRHGIEIYYSEVDATLAQESQVNYKYGKYRRGR